MGDKTRSFSPLPQHSELSFPLYYVPSPSHVAANSGSLVQNVVTYDLGQPSIPTPPDRISPSIYSYLVDSTTRGNSPTPVVSSTRGTISSMGKNMVVGQPIVSIPSMSTNVVIPSSSMGQPSWVQPTFIEPSWVYNYLGTKLPVINQNYQPTSLRVVYPIMLYP